MALYTMRNMLAATPLVSLQIVINLISREGTYKLPIKKIVDTPSFRLVDICNLHIQINGNNNIKVSDTRLKIPVTRR